MADELDPRVLRYFVAVAEELHFTRAAARLYVAQQALSREIARQEQQLGVRLFTRTTRRVALTAEGEHLLIRARELLALHDQTLQELHDLDDARPLKVDLLAEGHTPTRVLRKEYPLAALEAVPLAALRGTQVDASVGNDQAPEWVDLAVQLLAAFGAEPSPRHLHAVGLEETVEHLRSHARPILTLAERPIAPSVVVRPLTEPVPLYPWTMVYRRQLRHAGLDALHASADELARSERWLEFPPDAWIPAPDATTFELDANPARQPPPSGH